MANKQARALRDDSGNGVPFRVGDIVDGSAEVIAQLEKSGAVDSNKAAVKYAAENGGKVVVLEVEAEAPLAPAQ